MNDVVKVQFCVPPLRTKVRLAEPWTFSLISELGHAAPRGAGGRDRNEKMIKAAGRSLTASRLDPWRREPVSDVTLPTGTLLSIDRIYIRNGKQEYDSITFRIGKQDCPDERFRSVRFWAKLTDVNRIVCYPLGGEAFAAFAAFATAGQHFIQPGERVLDL